MPTNVVDHPRAQSGRSTDKNTDKHTGTLPDWLACPRCERGPLTRGRDELRCGQCNLSFPTLGGLPALYPDPSDALGAWRARLHGELRRLAHEAKRIEDALKGAPKPMSTRRRLVRMRDALRRHHDELRSLCAPFLAERPAAGHETYRALGTRPPIDEGLTTYAANVHRDWCWGDEENAASVEAIEAALPGPDRPRRLLVLGAGAGRLAQDLHARWGCELTATVDFNPMLALIAARMARGESLTLHEFPIAPRSIADQAVLRTLKAPEAAAPGLVTLLGDALHPPCADGSFDTVLTPWLIDVLPGDPSQLVARINRLLKRDGQWLCFGSMNLASHDPECSLGLEEVLELVEEQGFSAPEVHERELPYLCSPASRHHRREQIVTFRTERVRELDRRSCEPQLPKWLEENSAAVPRLPEFHLQALSTRVQLFILELIDGRRSLAEMAEHLEERRLMPRDEAEAEIRTFLTRLYETSRTARWQ